MYQTLSKRALVALLLGVGLLATSNLAFGQFLPGGGKNLSSAELPPDGVYLSPEDVHAMYTGPGLAIVLKAIQHRPFAHDKQSGPGPADETENSTSDMSGMVSVNGSPDAPASGSGPMTTVVHGKNTAGVPFQTEMLSLVLTGNTPFGPFMLRESPSRPSLGQTKITDLGGGMFHIDSFFDVFTELSIDGGNSWMESRDASGALAPTRVNLVPEPGTFTLMGLSILGLIGFARRRRRTA